MPDLPVPVVGRTRIEHQADHDRIALDHNLFDFDTAPSPGDTWTWDGSKWVPGAGGGGGGMVYSASTVNAARRYEFETSGTQTLNFAAGQSYGRIDLAHQGITSGDPAIIAPCTNGGMHGFKFLKTALALIAVAFSLPATNDGDYYDIMLDFIDGAGEWTSAPIFRGVAPSSDPLYTLVANPPLSVPQITITAGTEVYLLINSHGSSGAWDVTFCSVDLLVTGVVP